MKTSDPENKMKIPRRRFFTALMQGIIGTALTVSGGYLLLKEEKEDSCSLEFTCTLCGKSEQCGLPAARSFRDYERQNKKRK